MWNALTASSYERAPTSRMREVIPEARSASLRKCGGFTPTTPRTQEPSVARTHTPCPASAPGVKPPSSTKLIVPLESTALTMPPTSSPWASSMRTGFSPVKFFGVMRPSRSVFSSNVAQPSQNARATASVSSSNPDGAFASESAPRSATSSSLLTSMGVLSPGAKGTGTFARFSTSGGGPAGAVVSDCAPTV